MNGASQIKPDSSKDPDNQNPYDIRKKDGKYYCKYKYRSGTINIESDVWGETKLEVTAKVELLKYQNEK